MGPLHSPFQDLWISAIKPEIEGHWMNALADSAPKGPEVIRSVSAAVLMRRINGSIR